MATRRSDELPRLGFRQGQARGETGGGDVGRHACTGVATGGAASCDKPAGEKRKVKVEDGQPRPAPCAPAWSLRLSTRFTGLTPALRTPSTLPGVYLVKCSSRDIVVLPGHREGHVGRGAAGRRASSARRYQGVPGKRDELGPRSSCTDNHGPKPAEEMSADSTRTSVGTGHAG